MGEGIHDLNSTRKPGVQLKGLVEIENALGKSFHGGNVGGYLLRTTFNFPEHENFIAAIPLLFVVVPRPEPVEEPTTHNN